MCSLSCSWQCPLLGSTEEVFSFRQVSAWQFTAALCPSWLHRCGDELHTGSFLWFFSLVRCCHPLVSLALPTSISPMSPLVGCFGFSIIVHLFIFLCELLHFFFPLLSVLRAAVLSTSPNYSFSGLLEMVTFLTIFIEINLFTLKRTWFESSKQ